MGRILAAIGGVIESLLTHIDHYQRTHRLAGFLYAVFKKYTDDEAGHKAALIAYYGFLSLFPLLLVLASVVTLLAQSNQHLGDRITEGALTYLPVVGRDLQHSIHGLDKTGIALFAGILLTLFGARGVADAFRNSLDHLWQVPYVRRSTFPSSMLKSIGIILVGGLGSVLAPVVSGYALAVGHGIFFRLLALGIASVVLFWTLVFMVKVGSSARRSLHEVSAGVLVATVSIEVLQSVGGYLMTRELQRLDSLYGTFAIVLGLIFWIYLQTQVLLYALEIDVVREKRLWPRSLHGPLTPADHRAYELYSERTTYHEADAKPPRS